jgi:hypothetical protein
LIDPQILKPITLIDQSASIEIKPGAIDMTTQPAIQGRLSNRIAAL